MALLLQLNPNPESMGPWAMLFALIIGHAMADYPLQGKFLAIRKNRHIKPLEYGADVPSAIWVYCLSAHSLVHAGAAWLVTGSALYGLIEFLLHWIIDFAKCEKWTNFHQDQGLHLLSKLAYVLAIFWLEI